MRQSHERTKTVIFKNEYLIRVDKGSTPSLLRRFPYYNS